MLVKINSKGTNTFSYVGTEEPLICCYSEIILRKTKYLIMNCCEYHHVVFNRHGGPVIAYLKRLGAIYLNGGVLLKLMYEKTLVKFNSNLIPILSMIAYYSEVPSVNSSS